MPYTICRMAEAICPICHAALLPGTCTGTGLRFARIPYAHMAEAIPVYGIRYMAYGIAALLHTHRPSTRHRHRHRRRHRSKVTEVCLAEAIPAYGIWHMVYGIWCMVYGIAQQSKEGSSRKGRSTTHSIAREWMCSTCQREWMYV
jgi:hypothetical protein